MFVLRGYQRSCKAPEAHSTHGCKRAETQVPLVCISLSRIAMHTSTYAGTQTRRNARAPLCKWCATRPFPTFCHALQRRCHTAPLKEKHLVLADSHGADHAGHYAMQFSVIGTKSQAPDAHSGKPCISSEGVQDLKQDLETFPKVARQTANCNNASHLWYNLNATK